MKTNNSISIKSLLIVISALLFSQDIYAFGISLARYTGRFETVGSSTNIVPHLPAVPQTPPDSTLSPPPPVDIDSGKSELLWEIAKAQNKIWSKHVYSVVRDEVATQLLPGASDITKFCTKYDRLDNEERINFWGMLFSAVAKYESNFNPLARLKETTLGQDSVTGLPVYSEGLLQLSYQDTKWASYCEFDWAHDKLLSSNDPRKTILDPFANLSCGIKILAHQVSKRGKIALSTADGGYYWSTLVVGGKYTKLTEISSITQKMKNCN